MAWSHWRWLSAKINLSWGTHLRWICLGSQTSLDWLLEWLIVLAKMLLLKFTPTLVLFSCRSQNILNFNNGIHNDGHFLNYRGPWLLSPCQTETGPKMLNFSNLSQWAQCGFTDWGVSALISFAFFKVQTPYEKGKCPSKVSNRALPCLMLDARNLKNL